MLILPFVISFVVASVIAYFWADGITKMKDKHPDYKGDDFLNFDEEKFD